MTVYDANMQDDSNLDVTITEAPDLVTIDINPASFTGTISGGAVDSVNGQTGVVNLDTDDIPEGVNQYYSDTLVDNHLVSGDVALIALGDTTVGNLQWSDEHQTAELTMGGGVVQQMGEEIYYPKLTFNDTGATIPNGTPVMVVGGVGQFTNIAPAIANGTIPAYLYAGVATEDIADQSTGRCTYFGSVRDIDTSAWAKGTELFVSADNPGQFVTAQPASPDLVIQVGIVTYQHATEGRIFVRHSTIPEALQINYDNTESELVASNVKSAIDELQETKADISLLNSNITLYSTTAAGDFGYNRMVTDVTDTDYDTVAVDVPVPATGSLDVNSNDDGPNTELVGALIADAGLFVGNPGYINVPTIGNIRRQNDSDDTGSKDYYAAFYFKIFQRNAAGTETLIATSGHTPDVQPFDRPGGGGYVYESFNTSAILMNGEWLETDRLVIKYYADTSNADTNKTAYLFQFGGNDPVRTQLPVPVSVIPTADASGIRVDTTNFNGILSAADDDVQSALETLDDYTYVEIDPVFAASPSAGISAGDIANWNTAHGWGDHSTAGYLTSFTETDPVFTASPANGILSGDIANWNTAHGWGDHSTAGYLTEAYEIVNNGATAPRMYNNGGSAFKLVTDLPSPNDIYNATTTIDSFGISGSSFNIFKLKTTGGHEFMRWSANHGTSGLDDGTHEMFFEGRGDLINFNAVKNDNTAAPLNFDAATIRFHDTYTFPTADGTLDQVLSTDGNGNLSWADAGAGGGANALNDLTDVNIVSVQDGDILRYNGTATEWQNTNLGLSLTPILSGNTTGFTGQGHTITVTNHASYDDVNYFVQVKDSLGVVQVTNDQVTDNHDGTLTFAWPATADTYDIEVTAQDFGDLASDIATHQVTVSQLFGWTARYVRLANFTTANDPNDLMYNDLRFYTGTGQTGTALPADMTSATAPAPYVATSSDTGFSGYEFWKIFDNNVNSSFWTLGTSSSVANTWIQIDFGSAQTINSMEIRTGSQSSDLANGFTIFTSDTGAFAGEEVQRETLSNSDAINTYTYYN